MAQSIERPTFDFGSGCDPRVLGSSPMLGSVLSMEPAWGSLSALLPPLVLALSKIKKKTTLINNEKITEFGFKEASTILRSQKCYYYAHSHEKTWW